MARRMYSESQLKKLIEETAGKKLYQHNFTLSSADYGDINANCLQFSVLSTNPNRILDKNLEEASLEIAELLGAETVSKYLIATGKTSVYPDANVFQLYLFNTYNEWFVYGNDANTANGIKLDEFFDVDYSNIYVNDELNEVI